MENVGISGRADGTMNKGDGCATGGLCFRFMLHVACGADAGGRASCGWREESGECVGNHKRRVWSKMMVRDPCGSVWYVFIKA